MSGVKLPTRVDTVGLVEPTGFDIYGIKVNNEDIGKIQEAFNRTYQQIERQNAKWRNIEFCKRQMGSLWGAIDELLPSISKTPFEKRTLSMKDLFQPTVDQDNENFLEILSIELKENHAINDILGQLDSVEISEGSLKLWSRDRSGNRELKVLIEPSKFMEFVKGESKKIGNTLNHFVDAIKNNKRQIITASLIAGLLMTSIVAVSIGVASLIGVRLLISAGVTIVCVIADLMGSFHTLSEVAKVLFMRTGVHLPQNLDFSDAVRPKKNQKWTL